MVTIRNFLCNRAYGSGPVYQSSIGGMAMGWSLVPSWYEGDDSLEKTSSSCHIFLCMIPYLVPFEARSNLDELPF